MPGSSMQVEQPAKFLFGAPFVSL